MPAFIKSVTVDCADALVVARFWAAALGSSVDEDSTADKAYVEAPGWGGPNIWFVRVPEPKTVKNRLHLDLRSTDLATATDQALALGATRADDIYAGGRWQVLRDPEGNQFCSCGPVPDRRASGGQTLIAAHNTGGRVPQTRDGGRAAPA